MWCLASSYSLHTPRRDNFSTLETRSHCKKRMEAVLLERECETKTPASAASCARTSTLHRYVSNGIFNRLLTVHDVTVCGTLRAIHKILRIFPTFATAIHSSRVMRETRGTGETLMMGRRFITFFLIHSFEYFFDILSGLDVNTATGIQNEKWSSESPISIAFTGHCWGYIAMREFCIQNTYIDDARAAFTFLVIGRDCKRLADKNALPIRVISSDWPFPAFTFIWRNENGLIRIRYLEIMASILRSRIFMCRIVHFIAGELLRWMPAGATPCDLLYAVNRSMMKCPLRDYCSATATRRCDCNSSTK